MEHAQRGAKIEEREIPVKGKWGFANIRIFRARVWLCG